MFGYRQSKPDHVVQMLFFGKILQALAAPSELIQQFLADSLRVLTFPDGRNPVRARFASFHDFHSQQLDSHVRTRYDPWIHALRSISNPGYEERVRSLVPGGTNVWWGVRTSTPSD